MHLVMGTEKMIYLEMIIDDVQLESLKGIQQLRDEKEFKIFFSLVFFSSFW